MQKPIENTPELRAIYKALGKRIPANKKFFEEVPDEVVNEGQQFVGYSMHECFKDMALGLVGSHQVAKIIAGTAYEDEAMFEAGMKSYESMCWRPDVAPKAKELARAFWKAGLIEQPRLEGKPSPFEMKVLHEKGGHWTTPEKIGEPGFNIISPEAKAAP